ncbi:hypothetical protein [Parazoarcus communis]|uniref:hypothetical protein n=1 Tax=Parazoarcus communis TaxID=41977 RepID=UPI00131F17F4|nr:hypothetical protein [Parazoarcus communis]
MPNQKRKSSAPRNVIQGNRTLGRIGGRQAVFYNCRKAGGIIAAESPNERTVAQLADLDPRVVALQPQPFTVDVHSGALYTSREELEIARCTRVRVDATQRDYTPDFLLQLADGQRIVVEVKDVRYPGDVCYISKVEKAKAILKRRGHGFLTIAFRYEQTSPLVFNASVLSSEKNRDPQTLTPEDLSGQLDTLLCDTSAPLGHTMKALGLNMRTAAYFVLNGLLSANLHEECLNVHTLVTVAGGSLTHLELLPLEFKS